MHVQRFTSFDQLAPYRHRWDELAAQSLFQSWIWLTTWWQHYGHSQTDCRLAVFCVFDKPATSACQEKEGCTCTKNFDRLVAILPCYLQQTLTRGTILRLLGDGEVCSEHLSLLAEQQHEQPATDALAQYLVDHSTAWDLADFAAVEADNSGLNNLIEQLQTLECQVTLSTGQSCWSIELPATWDDFLAQQSKSHRKQLRRLDNRVLKSGQTTWHLVQTSEQFDHAWPVLVDLHQRRRISLSQPGCFASEQWSAFHRDVAQQLLATDQLRLSWLELDGKAIAAEYHFVSQKSTIAYQGGVDPDRLDHEPGRLSMIRTIQHAIDEGHTSYDLLRGDEPYKAHWRAAPQPTTDVQIVPARNAARLRYQVNNYLRKAGRFARQVTNLLS